MRNSTTGIPARRKIIGYLEGGRIRICSNNFSQKANWRKKETNLEKAQPTLH